VERETRKKLAMRRRPLTETILLEPPALAGTVNEALNEPCRVVRVLTSVLDPSLTTTRCRRPKWAPRSEAVEPPDPEAGVSDTLLSACAGFGTVIKTSSAARHDPASAVLRSGDPRRRNRIHRRSGVAGRFGPTLWSSLEVGDILER
jgi:hypothetical protein